MYVIYVIERKKKIPGICNGWLEPKAPIKHSTDGSSTGNKYIVDWFRTSDLRFDKWFS